MVFDEQSSSGFAVVLSAPGQSNVAGRDINGPLASLEACTVPHMHALGPAKIDVYSAVMFFSLDSIRRMGARSAVPLPASSAIH
jgi:hypothetical protein